MEMTLAETFIYYLRRHFELLLLLFNKEGKLSRKSPKLNF